MDIVGDDIMEGIFDFNMDIDVFVINVYVIVFLISFRNGLVIVVNKRDRFIGLKVMCVGVFFCGGCEKCMVGYINCVFDWLG